MLAIGSLLLRLGACKTFPFTYFDHHTNVDHSRSIGMYVCKDFCKVPNS